MNITIIPFDVSNYPEVSNARKCLIIKAFCFDGEDIPHWEEKPVGPGHLDGPVLVVSLAVSKYQTEKHISQM